MQESLFDFELESPPASLASISPHSTNQYEEVIINGSKMFSCLTLDCGKTFKYKSEMTRHIAIHLNHRPYVCTYPDCKKTFKRNDALTNHYRVHNKKAAFSCPVAGCMSEFTTKSALRLHLLKHEGEKAFECSYPGCNKTFTSHHELKQHEQIACFKPKMEAAPSQTVGSIKLAGIEDVASNIENVKENILGHFSPLNVDYKLREHDFKQKIEELKSEGQLDRYNFPTNLSTRGNLAVSTDISELSMLGKKSGRNLEDILISLLTYMTEENQQLKKKLKHSTDVLKGKLPEMNHLLPQTQNVVEEQEEFPNFQLNQDLADVDCFFKSSLRREDCGNNE